jgi:hypothetical protein
LGLCLGRFFGFLGSIAPFKLELQSKSLLKGELKAPLPKKAALRCPLLTGFFSYGP